MNGLIIACGKKDSLGKDRFTEPRGLLRFNNREVAVHTVEKMAEVGVTSVGIITEHGLRKQYESIFEKHTSACSVHVEESSGLDSIAAYIHGALKFFRGDPLIAIADDNLFTFSLAPLIESALQRGKSVLAVRDRAFIGRDTSELNMGEVIVDNTGKINRFTDPFTHEKRLNSRLVGLDIWIFHPSTVSSITTMIQTDTPRATITEAFLDDLYCHEINDGFWADVGKEPLRHAASLYFSHDPPIETATPVTLKTLSTA